MGYGDPGYYYGSGYYDPGYTYGTDYTTGYGVATRPGSTYGYSSAYGPTPMQSGSSASASTFPLPSLGIEEEAVSDGSKQAIRVVSVQPNTPAQRAGLQPGALILAANGYLTQTPGNLAWIINHQAQNGTLNLTVRMASSGQETKTTVQLR
jgi:S1-C subfamily serine protease